MAFSISDYLFTTKIDSWSVVYKPWYDLFSAREMESIRLSERAFDVGKRRVVFLAFENRFAALGGLAAVTRKLPAAMSDAGEQVIFMTPWHQRSTAMLQAAASGIFKPVFERVAVCAGEYQTLLSCFVDTSSALKSYYLLLDGRFAAGDDPYGYENQDDLLFDSLAFCAAVPLALKNLHCTDNIILHCNDWETAACAVSSKLALLDGTLRQARTILTLHNSFDYGFPARQKRFFCGREFPGETVLQATIPLLNGPLTTVSTPFARELCVDPIQRSVFTPHLQREFRANPPVGIENGMFGGKSSLFTKASMEKGARGNFRSILDRKALLRKKFLETLDGADDPRIVGRLVIKRGSTVPIFFMSGRLDLMQKGFDVVFHAFRRLPKGSAKLFFGTTFPAGREESLRFFEQAALKCKGDIMIWPMRIPAKQYEMFQCGSSFMLMPSFYEPFGAANEGLLKGVPVVARGTGGLWQQITPWGGGVHVPEIYRSAHDPETNPSAPTGILYREEIDDQTAQEQWRALLSLPPERRPECSLYAAMVEAALTALRTAISLYASPAQYGEVVYNGLAAAHQFTWDKAVERYGKVYDVAAYRGI